jgi:hypothetical protein
MNQVSRYRKHAQQSRTLAEKAETDEERHMWSQVAHHWDAIAELHERLRQRAREPQHVAR